MKLIEKLMQQLAYSLSPYHAVECAKQQLVSKGFCQLHEGATWDIRANGKYFVIKDGSALLAFTVGESPKGYNIVASHTDSPCLKVKYNPVVRAGKCTKLNVERYGGLLQYSFLDTPLTLAGRVVTSEGDTITATLYASQKQLVIPSLAIHMNREANTALSLNAQNELMPLLSLDETATLPVPDGTCDYDLFLANAVTPRLVGLHDELLLSPRIDNLSSVFASIEALCNCTTGNVNMAFLSDNEEVGSTTKQGAASTFLTRTLARITKSLSADLDEMLNNSFIVSADNAHATHPNYLSKSDPTNNVTLGGGVVVKHHANQNYTTDALSSAVIDALAKRAGVDTQHFFMRADMPCGSTLGAISSSQVSIRSVDIGLPQLAMHSACETAAATDYEQMVKLLGAFYDSNIEQEDYFKITVK